MAVQEWKSEYLNSQSWLGFINSISIDKDEKTVTVINEYRWDYNDASAI